MDNILSLGSEECASCKLEGCRMPLFRPKEPICEGCSYVYDTLNIKEEAD